MKASWNRNGKEKETEIHLAILAARKNATRNREKGRDRHISSLDETHPGRVCSYIDLWKGEFLGFPT